MSTIRGTAIVRWGAVTATVTLLLVGCGAKKSVSSAGSGPSTTTTAPPPPVAPLTGMLQPNAAAAQQVAVAVKIDNVDAARPQAGLNGADVVFEEQVEGQLTRLLAVFQSSYPTQVGPVRSTRTSDIDIVSALNHPLYAYSGGNTNYVAQLDAAPVVDVGAAKYAAPYYFYRGPHLSPHDLYTNTTDLLKLAPGGSGPPPPLFRYRAPGQAVTASGAAPATHVDLSFGQSTAAWDWSAASQMWERSQNGTADVLQNGLQIATPNVIVQVIPYVPDGYATGEGVSPPPAIPKGEMVGTGTAMVFTGGMVIPATWSKASPTAVTVYTDSLGHPILLAPGPTWVELAPTGTTPNVH